MSAIRIFGWPLLAVALLCVQGCDSDSEPPAPRTQQVGVITVANETVTPRIELPGRTVASETSQVRPQVGGLLTDLLFQEGGMVQAGQPLYQIDPSLFQAQVDQATANLKLAQATLKTAQLQAARYADLIKIDGVSQQELDDARAARDEARATVAANQALLDTAQVNLQYTRVTAPITGRIGRTTVTRGALVTASQEEELATIQKLDPMHVDLTQSGDQYLRLRRELMNGEATALSVGLQTNDGEEHAGTLVFSDIAVDAATGTVTLRASFPNPDQSLLPGMYVRAYLNTIPMTDALLVPQGAVIRDTKGEPYVWIVTAENVVESRPVTLGVALNNRWLVESGLASGDRVVIDGLQGLQAGMAVDVVDAS